MSVLKVIQPKRILTHSLKNGLTLSTAALVWGQDRKGQTGAVISEMSGRQNVVGRVIFCSIWSLFTMIGRELELDIEMQETAHYLYQKV